jgi:ATP-binding cassette subfamily C protein
MLTRLRTGSTATELPKPTESLDVEGIAVGAPGSEAVILRDIRFKLNAGEALGIIGPSGAGKTSLLRTLVGIWPPLRGTARLDGAALNQWDPEALGRSIGLVSQGVELFDGTIAENIARMAIEPDSEAVLRAARTAGAHDMILKLPAGYDTRIGEGGTILSAGQRQRIGFARALFGEPFMVVLDEPHANLDNEGEIALTQALQALKARGAVVIIIAHRPSAIAVCDKVLVVANGAQQAFGPRDEVLQKVVARPGHVQPMPTSLKVVGDPSGGDR